MIIKTDFIKLDSFLKLMTWVESGGMAKMVISDGIVFVNGERETKRGRKLYSGDVVEMMGMKETVERE